MKYLSLFILLLLMSTSWSYINTPRGISEEAHAGLQDNLQEFITDYIHKELPSAKNLRFERMWTEEISDSKIKASFIYSFDDDSSVEKNTNVQINGYAILNKRPPEKNVDPNKNNGPSYDTWSFDELHILNNHIRFTDGVLIHPDPNPSDTNDNESPNEDSDI